MKKTKKMRLLDPWLEREQKNYSNPLPSREFVQQILSEQGSLSISRLVTMLQIEEHEEPLFVRRLRAMERDGQLVRGRKGILSAIDQQELVKGRIQGHPDGYGFLVPEGDGPDLFLTEKEMYKVLHNDIALAMPCGTDRRGRVEGRVVEVLERANRQVVGRLHELQGEWFVVAENRRLNQDIVIADDQRNGAELGQVVIAEIVQQPDQKRQAIGQVKEVLGGYTDPGMEIEIALRKHDLPHEFPYKVVSQAEAFAPQVPAQDWQGREDIRHLPLVTIDGETARDFDDAVYCEKVGEGFRLVVAIADVSHYVTPDSALDREAMLRGNSVYFPRRVIPMLPEALSNGLCSLNPQQDRLCMVCDMQIDAKGNISQYRFYPSVMYSHARLTYTQVAHMLEQPKGELAMQHKSLLPHLKSLHRVFKKLLQARAKRGAIDFDTVETQMIFDDHGKIDRIEPVIRNEAHKLIEECMLAANVCSADFLLKHKHPALFRIHQGPTPEKLQSLRDFLKSFGLRLTGGDEPQALDYASLLKRVHKRPDAGLLQTVMLRSLRQANYEPDNVGHFGLGYDAYTHFTSPIRRYPDLLVHRAINAVLQKKQYKPEQSWETLGTHCSSTERRADEATRDVEAWLKCFYMQEHLGCVFSGSIAAVTGFGMFVSLDDLYIEGLVHISELGKDYFHYDETRHSLIGERSGQSYQIGDRVSVKVARVDMDNTKLDFVLSQQPVDGK